MTHGSAICENCRAVLFDLDGTIADTNDVILRTLAETLEAATGRAWRREELMPHWGMRLRDQLALLHPAIDFARAVPFYRRRYLAHQRQWLAEFPGVRPLLEALRAAGYALGVVTSKKRENARMTLEGLGYDPLIPLLIAEEDTARHKPAPDPLLAALDRLALPAEQALYVGDNPDDITAAHAAGMPAVAVGWALRPRAELLAVAPEALIDRPEELLALITPASGGHRAYTARAVTGQA